jgi:hypothetical protein
MYIWNGTTYEPFSGGGGGSTITVVANYSALPDPTTVSGQFYWCSASQGTYWLPGSLGGNYRPSGLYYSNGTSWEYTPTPYNASQSVVNTGTNDDQFITPKTFNNSAQLAGKVPYTGATANVDLGTFHLDAGKGTFSHNGSTDTLTANHTSGSGIGLLITKGGANEGLKVNKTSGSGNAATIIGTLEATTLVKTGGTSAEFLMADGSTNTSVVPTTRNITINGTTQDLSADRVFTVGNKFAIIGSSGATTGAGLSRFVMSNNTTSSVTENARSIIIPFSVNINKMYIGTGTSQPATGSSEFTLRKNGVATSIVVVVPAGSALGTFSNTVNSVSFLSGDLLSIEHINNASSTSATVNQITISE